MSEDSREVAETEEVLTLPALYCVTLCWVCFLQPWPLQ